VDAVVLSRWLTPVADSVSSMATLRIATRKSPLALWQARHVSALLAAAHPGLMVELVEVSTTGDLDQTQPLREFGGLGVFTREVQRVVLDQRADLAVHSLKDLPTEPHPELTLGAIPERGATADALVLPLGQTVTDSPYSVPPGGRIGTGSPRRQSQVRALRPDVTLVEVRGNVDTRLRKLDQGECDALILACAGLERLGLGDRISQRLGPPAMYHAVGQGAIGIECRSSDELTKSLLAAITHCPTWAAVTAERSLLATLRAGCHAPVGVATAVNDGRLTLTGVVLTTDGQQCWTATATADIAIAAEIGKCVAELLLRQGAMVG
jgi:hydroxymethylbilane synthase